MTPHEPITISVVIPTRNRPDSLLRLLGALSLQTRRPDEAIVVDASDAPLDAAETAARFPTLKLRHRVAAPGVCAQRNLGIREASGSHVLLCDDDIEPPPRYLETLAERLRTHPAEGAVTGVIDESDGRGGMEAFPVPRARHLAFTWLFQLTVRGDVEATSERGPTGPLARILKAWYRRRGNTWSRAGWPLLTQVGGAAVRASIYGLGAALVRRAWLLRSPFDERLGPHGIGENYGVAAGFPERPGITVLTDLPVAHHRASENRLDPAETLRRRILALDYFLRTGRAPGATPRWLAWSLIGTALAFAARGRRAQLAGTLRALPLVLTGRNPLLAPTERA